MEKAYERGDVQLQIFFPCEKVESETQKKKKEQRGKSPHDAQGDIKRYGTYVKLEKKEPSPSANDIFQSCCNDQFVSILNPNSFSECIYYVPAGVYMHRDYYQQTTDCPPCDCVTLVNDWLRIFEEAFTPLSIADSNGEKPNWIVYNNPICLVECGDEEIQERMANCLNTSGRYNLKEKSYKNKKLYIDNNLVIYTRESCGTDITDIVFAVMHLKLICGKAKWALSRILSKYSNETHVKRDVKAYRERTTSSIRRQCERYEAIITDTLFYERSKQSLFIEFYRASGMGNDLHSVKSSKAAITHTTEEQVKDKASAIENVVTITGFAGLLFSIYAFFNISGSNIFSFSTPINGWNYLEILLGLTICFVVLVISSLCFARKKLITGSILLLVCILVVLLLAIMVFVLFKGVIQQ